MPDGNVETALGKRIADLKKVKTGVPPVILSSQAHGYVVLEKPEELRQWESDLKQFHGISMDASGLAGIAAETCSNGCSDSCDMV